MGAYKPVPHGAHFPTEGMNGEVFRLAVSISVR